MLSNDLSRTNQMRKASFYNAANSSNYDSNSHNDYSPPSPKFTSSYSHCPEQIAEESSPNRSIMGTMDFPSPSGNKFSNPSIGILSTNISAIGTEAGKSSDFKQHEEGRRTMPVYNNHTKENNGIYTLKFNGNSFKNLQFGHQRRPRQKVNNDSGLISFENTCQGFQNSRPSYSIYENSRNERIAFSKSRANSSIKITDNYHPEQNMFYANFAGNETSSQGGFKNRTHSINFYPQSHNPSLSEHTGSGLNTIVTHSGDQELELNRPKSHQRARNGNMRSFVEPTFTQKIKEHKQPNERVRNKTCVFYEGIPQTDKVRNLSSVNYTTKDSSQLNKSVSRQFRDRSAGYKGGISDSTTKKVKSSKKTSKYLTKNVSVPWKGSLRVEDSIEAQRRKISKLYQVKRVKVSAQKIKSLLRDLYHVFTAQNTTKHLSYEEFEERLAELKILNDDEADALKD